MTDFVPEDECPLCGSIAPNRRKLFRLTLFRIPLDKPLCWPCTFAFWQNMGRPEGDDEDEPSGDRLH